MSFVTNAGSAVVGHIGASESARTQNLSNRLSREAAIAEYGRQDAALGKRQGQEADAASARKADVALQARSARATNAVAAGEAGIAGFTVDSLMQDIIAQEGRFNERTDTNLDWTVDQLQESKKGAQAQMRDRINSLRDVTPPSFVETGLKIGSAAVNAGTTYLNLAERRSRPSSV
ncbi:MULTISPECIES: hypothetical protein [Methylobacterium]|uniref:Uncharacterized protein n=4 Tax=Pseudomonadota TaxID=1224 RepID=A0ABQ4SVG9_9HYPH|nr:MULTISPECIES: hypothetical protein [Methylobacterium]PIU05874.1 MAG: hypothetical protein COT56_12700 [Methylobacterium sp. CG09_land_8_20_14_0_10_71_15]PIU16338.1 MAG: hypothetical protein COT28_00845 [Methylobacterium sp. CG08_land_8_20_14_0_20_71_15]GJE06463.1 hypothetical protein AOPFMNJM_1783 [Methylobacterium jeotgali]